MPPRLDVRGAFRSLTIRSRPLAQRQQPRMVAVTSRTFASEARPPTDSNSNSSSPAPSESPRASPASTSSSNGMAADAPASGEVTMLEPTPKETALGQLELVANGLDPFDVNFAGHKFGIPSYQGNAQFSHKNRYDPVVKQITNLLMREGKLSKAQRDMAMILNYLRSAPAPKVSPSRPLIPGAPPPSHLPLDPVLYLTLAVDSVAPLVRIRNFAGLAGGGAALPVPVPLMQRQRRRMAWMWIMEVVNKKPSKGSGRTMLAHRIAEEIVAVVEGRSSVWDKRQILHKQGTAARANVNSPALRKRKRM
ncbi:hypothetical protein NKR23_g3157 [Pleurostoma richardsiae]|uniref:Small ribosomal subunit protein uS7m n=1 Tax=Pleurostoma richardsiae TaxID=41990 RepID=A0AA38RMQ5_9PEZI|nr:hypothetical protein NKR23_g3157 [Pleurostoma richardsiae]